MTFSRFAGFARPFARLGLALQFAFGAVALAAGAQAPGSAAEPPPRVDAAARPVGVFASTPQTFRVFNRDVAVLRARVLGSTPEQRAESAGESARALVRRGIFAPVAQRPHSEGILITVGGEIVLLAVAGDVDPLSEETLAHYADGIARRLAAALQEAQSQSDTGEVLSALGKAAGATVLYVALMLLTARGNRLLRFRLLVLERRLSSELKERGLHTLLYGTRVLQVAARAVFWGVQALLLLEWLAFVLRAFPYTRPWGDGLHAQIGGAVLGVGSAILHALPDLLVIAVIVVLTRGIVGLVRAFFRSVQSGRIAAPWMEAEAALATQRIAIVVIWLFAIVMVYPYLPGSSSAAFKGMSVFVGLLISLGSGSVIGQFTSGLVLMYSRALKPGEYVRIGELEGTVETLGFLSTKIRSPKNEELHVPNVVILGTTVKNYSRFADGEGVMLHTAVTIGYDAPWRQVHALLIEAADRTSGLLRTPRPFVLQTALADFYVEYQINARLADPAARPAVLSALHANIQDAFNAYGVQIMSPHYRKDKPQPVTVPKEKWAPPPATPDA